MPTIPIKNGQVKLDDDELAWSQERKWHLGDTGYAKCYSGTPGGTPLRMHRLIMERILGRRLEKAEYVDHVNGDRLDNRRTNLRLASWGQNNLNRLPKPGCRSEYKGVGYTADGRSKAWMAYINYEGKRWYLGRYYTQEEAAWMYDQWAIELHGEFARLNFEYEPVATQKNRKEIYATRR